MAQRLVIESLKLKNVAAVKAAELRPAAEGVTVVYGPNESGKSTLLKSYSALFDPDLGLNTTRSLAKKLAPVEVDARPQVSINLRSGNQIIEHSRSIGRSGKALLKLSGDLVETSVGKPGWQRFLEISKEMIDPDLRAALTIEQDTIASISGLGGFEGLSALLQGEGQGVGRTAGISGLLDEVGDRLFQEIQKWYKDNVAKRGTSLRPKAGSKLKSAREDKEEEEKTFAGLQAELETFNARTSEISQLAQRQRELEQGQLEQEQLQVGLRDELSEAEEKYRVLRSLQNEHDQLRLEFFAVTGRDNERSQLIDDIAAATRALQDTRLELSSKEAEVEAAISQLSTLEASRDVVDRFVEVGEKLHELKSAAESDLNAADIVAQSHSAHRECVSSLRSLEEAEREVQKADQAWIGDSTAGAVAGVLRSFRRDLANRDGIAIGLTVSGPDSGEFVLGERSVPFGEAVRIHQKRSIQLGEYTIELDPRPDASDSQDLATALDNAAASLNQMLGETQFAEEARSVGVLLSAEASSDEISSVLSSLEDGIARQRDGRDAAHQRKREALSDTQMDLRRLCQAARTAPETHNEIREELQKGAGQDHISGLIAPVLAEVDEAHAARRDQVAELARQLSQRMDALPAAVDPRLETARKILVEEVAPVVAVMREGRSFNTEHVRELENAARVQHDTRQIQQKILGEIADIKARSSDEIVAMHRDAVARAEKSRTELQEQLSQDREKESDQQLAELAETVKVAFDNLTEKLAQANAECAGCQTPDDLRVKLDGIRTRIVGLQRDRGEVRERIERLQGSIEGAGNLRDKYERSKARLEEITAKHDRAEREFHGYIRLHTLFTEQRDALARKHQGPFAEYVEQYARMVFGEDTSFDYDDNSQVESRRIGSVKIERDSLSGGAKEQLGIVSRVALARLAAETTPAPILFDDVLAFSDEERARKMNDVLAELGTHTQVIVFTCDKDRFSSIPGATMISMDEILKDPSEVEIAL